MEFRKKIKKISLLILFLGSNTFGLYAQDTNESLLIDNFDKAIGLGNLGINNGTLHLNPYRIRDNKNRYYPSEIYSTGTVSYDGQFYSDMSLLYDSFKDVLIKKIEGETNYMGINLIQEKTARFTINNEAFVNLSYGKTPVPEFINGYYEEYRISPDFMFYIKHHKEINKFIVNESVFYEFEAHDAYFINYKDTFYKIDSKAALIMLFPKCIDKINDYFLMNKKIEKEDKTKFMKNLMKYINSLPLNESN